MLVQARDLQPGDQFMDHQTRTPIYTVMAVYYSASETVVTVRWTVDGGTSRRKFPSDYFIAIDRPPAPEPSAEPEPEPEPEPGSVSPFTALRPTPAADMASVLADPPGRPFLAMASAVRTRVSDLKPGDLIVDPDCTTHRVDAVFVSANPGAALGTFTVLRDDGPVSRLGTDLLSVLVQASR